LKAGFGDIVFDPTLVQVAKLPGGGLQVTIRTATIGPHLGQSWAWAVARLWGRRIFVEWVPIGLTGAAAYYWYKSLE
jgi:hypothetical protein